MEGQRVRLGGMALVNGLLVHGPTYWAAAVRTGTGELKVASGRKPVARGPLAQLPGVRGVAKLAEAFAVIPLVKIGLPEAKLPFEDLKVMGSMAFTGALTAATRRAGRGPATELLVSILGLAPALLALRGSDLAAYHGVEHKAIGAYEVGADPALATKEHERCGSNLVAPMLVATALGNYLVERAAGKRGPLVRAAVSLASAAIAVELFAWSERNRDTAIARALRVPGHEMQRLFVTREPADLQMEVGEAALEEILWLELSPLARAF